MKLLLLFISITMYSCVCSNYYSPTFRAKVAGHSMALDLVYITLNIKDENGQNHEIFTTNIALYNWEYKNVSWEDFVDSLETIMKNKEYTPKIHDDGFYIKESIAIDNSFLKKLRRKGVKSVYSKYVNEYEMIISDVLDIKKYTITYFFIKKGILVTASEIGPFKVEKIKVRNKYYVFDNEDYNEEDEMKKYFMEQDSL
jgi:hypothetical protein